MSLKLLKRDDLLVSLFEERYRKQLVSMWQEAFSDTEEYINGFFDSRCAKTYVYSENEVPMGMVSVFDITLNGNKGAYIYALTVDKAYRRKGVATALIGVVQESLSEDGYSFSLVVPSPYQALESFYKKLGYEGEIGLGVTKYCREQGNFSFDFEKATPSEYLAVRQKQKNIVLHSQNFYNYIYNDLICEGVEILKIKIDLKDVFCVCYNKGEYVIIKELLGETDPKNVAQIVMRIFDAPKSACISFRGEKRYPYALVSGFGADCDFIYANLLLDDFENRF